MNILLVIISIIGTIYIIEYFDLSNYILYDDHVSIYGIYRKILDKIKGVKK